MFRRWIRKHLPSPEHFDRYPITRRFKPYLSHPGLWAINRRSVAGGVAAGLFCGLIPGPFQIGGALVWALVWRINIPVAFLVTLYTNPLSIVPLYAFAAAYGHLLLGSAGAAPDIPPLPQWDWGMVSQSSLAMFDWMLGLGPSLAVGLPATMITFSVLGYFWTRVLWNLGIRIAVLRRRNRRAQRQLPR